MAFNKILTDKFKKIVRYDPNYLYDTGALDKSIKVDLSMVKTNILVTITCEDYIKFHTEKYGLIPQFTNTPEFSSQIKAISEPWLFTELRKSLLTGKPVPKLKVKVSINGI